MRYHIKIRTEHGGFYFRHFNTLKECEFYLNDEFTPSDISEIQLYKGIKTILYYNGLNSFKFIYRLFITPKDKFRILKIK